MALLNPWQRLRTARRTRLQTQRDVVEASPATLSMQEAAFEELRSAMAANQAALEELRTTCNRLVTVLGDPRGVAYGRERPMIEQLVQVLLRQQYRELANRGGPLPDFADVEFRCNSQNGEDGILLYIFSLIGMTTHMALEICAGDGIECNAANLILNHGFHGLLFDGNAELIERGRAF